MIKLDKYNICNIFFWAAPLYVCSIVFGRLSMVLLLISISLCLFYLYKTKRTQIDIFSKTFLFLYFFPIVVSIFISYITLINYNHNDYSEYFCRYMPSRVLNLSILGFIYIISYAIIAKLKDYNKLLYNYSLIIFIVFGVFGIWEILSLTLGLPSLNLGTRSHIHSVANVNALSNFRRITSFADEPSYLVPFLIDAIILLFFLKRKLMTLILIFILFFSLSFGGYVNFFLLFFCYLFLIRKQLRLKYICYAIVFILAIVILASDVLLPLLEIILARKELSSDFQADDTGRTFVIYSALQNILESNFINILFGHGPSSFKYFGIKLLGENTSMTSSNNIFIDFLYEGGLFSMFCIILFFIRIYYIFDKLKNKHNCRIVLLAKMLIIHLVLSSMYRGDYVTPRFFVIILILGLLFHVAQRLGFQNKILKT